MRFLIHAAIALPMLLCSGLFNFTVNTPEAGVKDYMKKVDEDYSDDYVVVCITHNDHALCQKNGTNYVCYDSLIPPGCGVSKWSCIEWDNDVPGPWANP